MKNWLNPGLWIALAIIMILGFWPILIQNAAAREVGFSTLLARVLAARLNSVMGYTG